MMFEVMDAVNVAQGEVAMVEAHGGLGFYTILKLPYPIAFCLAIVSTMILGMLMDVIV